MAGVKEITDFAGKIHVNMHDPFNGFGPINMVDLGFVHRRRMVDALLNDDITGEHLAHAIEALLDDGALDVWTEPITRKKGRPAHSLNLLCAPERAIELQDLVSARTGSLGVRAVLIGRSSLARRTETVEVLGQRIRLKVTAVGTKPEFDDVAAAAGATGRSLAEIDALARAALRSCAQAESRSSRKAEESRKLSAVTSP